VHVARLCDHGPDRSHAAQIEQGAMKLGISAHGRLKVSSPQGFSLRGDALVQLCPGIVSG
jgi:hypothetical protein